MSLRMVSGTAWLLIAVCLTALSAGLSLGWIEMVVLAATSAAALLVAIPFVLGARGLELQRSLPPLGRVTVGDTAFVETIARNPSSKTSPSTIVEELVDGVVEQIEIGRLGTGESVATALELPTHTRGVVLVGPATVARSDPFGLLRRSIGYLGREQIWVHPEYRVVGEPSSGFARDLEGRTFDTSPAGDVAFHTIREYTPGDDIRHIHWMSTARQTNGSLMVRHYVDNRRPSLCVVVDPALHEADRSLFEVAIEAAASLGVSGIGRKLAPPVFIGKQQLLNPGAPTSSQQFLDRLSEYEAPDVPDDPVASVARSLDEHPATSVLVFATGASSEARLREVLDQFRRKCRIVVVNAIHEDGSGTATIPRVTTLNVSDLKGFAAAWAAL